MRSLTVACVLIFFLLIWKTVYFVKCDERFGHPNVKLGTKLFSDPWLNLKMNMTLRSWVDNNQSTTTYPSQGDGKFDGFLNKRTKHSYRISVTNETDKSTKSQSKQSLDLQNMTKRSIITSRLQEYKNRTQGRKSNQNSEHIEQNSKRFQYTKDKSVQVLRTKICNVFNMNNINNTFCDKQNLNITKGVGTKFHKINTNDYYLVDLNYINLMNKLKLVLKNNIEQMKHAIKTRTSVEGHSLYEKEASTTSQLTKRNTDHILLNKSNKNEDYENDIQDESDDHKQMFISNEIEDIAQSYRNNDNLRAHLNQETTYIDKTNNLNEGSRSPTQYHARYKDKYTNTIRNMMHSKNIYDNEPQSNLKNLYDTGLKPFTNESRHSYEDNKQNNLSSRLEQNVFQYVSKTKSETENENPETSTTNMEQSANRVEQNNVAKTPSNYKMKNSFADIKYIRHSINARLNERIYSLLLHSYRENKMNNIDPGNTEMLKNLSRKIVHLLQEPKYKREMCILFQATQNLESHHETSNIYSNESNLTNESIPATKNTSEGSEEYPETTFKFTYYPINVSSNSVKNRSVENTSSGRESQEEMPSNESSVDLTTPTIVEREETFPSKNQIQEDMKKPPRKLFKKTQVLEQNEIPPKNLQKAEGGSKQLFIKYSPNKQMATTDENKTNTVVTTASDLVNIDHILESKSPYNVMENVETPTQNSVLIPESLNFDNGNTLIVNISENVDKNIWTTETNLDITSKNELTDSIIATTETSLLTTDQKNRKDDFKQPYENLNRKNVLNYSGSHLENNHTNELINPSLFPIQKLYIVGSGIRIPLKFDRKPDGTFLLTVDIDALCPEKCLHKSNTSSFLPPKINRTNLNLTITAIDPERVVNESMSNEINSSKNNGELSKSNGNSDYGELRRSAKEAPRHQLERKNDNEEQNKEEISKLLEEYDDVYNFLNSFNENDLQDILLKQKQD